MHRAPAVNFAVKPSRWQARIIVGASLLAVATLFAFVQGRSPWDLGTLLLAATIALSSGVAFVGWRQSPLGNLRWDSQQWHWSGFPVDGVCRLVVVMDFQRVVLVSVQSEMQRAVHLWLEAPVGDANWKPFRRALVSSQPRDGAGKQTDQAPEGELA
jgi:hypothetical protein